MNFLKKLWNYWKINTKNDGSTLAEFIREISLGSILATIIYTLGTTVLEFSLNGPKTDWTYTFFALILFTSIHLISKFFIKKKDKK